MSDDLSNSSQESSQFKKREDIIRNLESLAEKSRLIYSDDLNDQEISVEYFRRLLSIGKIRSSSHVKCLLVIFIDESMCIDRKPPVNVVIEKGVLPRLVELLSSSRPKIAFEAAWCITNISCGENQYLQMLMQLGIIPKLLRTICETSHINIREQCMWAVSNLATDITGSCKAELLSLDILKLLLWQLDIGDPPTNYPRQESPALSIMRYTAWILCSLCKGEPVLPPVMQQQVVFAFAELLYSPDTEIIGDICIAICLLCEQRVENVQYCLEQGMPIRLIELCESNYSFAVRPLSVMVASPCLLNRRVLMSPSLCPNILKIMINELRNVSVPSARVNVNVPVTRAGPIVGTAGSYIGIPEAGKSTKMLDEIVEDICKALLILMQTDPCYTSQAYDYELLDITAEAILQNDSYLIKSWSGYCLCEILEQVREIKHDLVSSLINSMKELFKATDNLLLTKLLSCILKLLRMVQRDGFVIEIDLSDDSSLHWLCNHPSKQISQLATQIEEIFASIHN
jgi:hypothetical protein